jgi:hypothetical protein
MPDLQIRRATVATRREGRRSHSAYGSHARGTRLLVGNDRVVRLAQARERGQAAVGGRDVGAWSAGIALALVYPFVRRTRRARGTEARNGAMLPSHGGSEGNDMAKKPSIKSLETVTGEEAQAYLDYARGDELNAAYALACDRNRLDGSIAPPDDAEVHHALFLLCRARGKNPPSFDQMRYELRRRAAA